MWRVSQYGDFSGPFFLVFVLNTEAYSEQRQTSKMVEIADDWNPLKSSILDACQSSGYACYETFQDFSKNSIRHK